MYLSVTDVSLPVTRWPLPPIHWRGSSEKPLPDPGKDAAWFGSIDGVEEMDGTPIIVIPSAGDSNRGRIDADAEDCLLPRPFLKPRRQLFQIDAIEADLVLVL